MNKPQLLTSLAFLAILFLMPACRQGIEDAISHHPNDQPDDMYFVIHSPGIILHLDTGDGPQTISRKYDPDGNGSKDITFTLSYSPDTCSQTPGFFFSSEMTSLKANMFMGKSFEAGENSLQLSFGDSILLDHLDSPPQPYQAGVNDHWTQSNPIYLNDCSSGTTLHEFTNSEYLPLKYIGQDGAHLAWIQLNQKAPQIVDTLPLRMAFDLEIIGWSYNRAPRNDIFAGQIRD